MGTTADKLQGILDSKADIKDAIEAKGVTVGDIPFSEYASKILEIGNHKEIEYIESSGTQFIITDFVPKDTPRIVTEISFKSTVDKDIFGFESNTVPSWIGDMFIQPNNKMLYYYRYYNTSSRSVNDQSTYQIGDYITIDAGNQLIVNGVTVGSYTKESFKNNSQAVRIFSGRSTNISSIRMKYCKLYDGDVLVRDLIPVIYLGNTCMYDKITKTYYNNAGSGDFIAGPEIDAYELLNIITGRD